MLNYLKKFAVDILPSVAATVIGAYIVNHYIVDQARRGCPGRRRRIDRRSRKAAEAKPAAKSDRGREQSPAAGVKAKGISEKAMMEKTAAERPAVVEKAQEKSDAKPTQNLTRRPKQRLTQTAPIRRPRPRAFPPTRAVMQPAPREKKGQGRTAVARAARRHPPWRRSRLPPIPAPPVETAVAPDERRDANDLARAAIERLRGNGEVCAASSRRPPRAPECSARRDGAADRWLRRRCGRCRRRSWSRRRPASPMIRVRRRGRLMPPSGHDPRRPTPPADIPLSRPLDLRAEAAEPSARERTTAVAEDVLSAAKSVFHAVLPK